MSDFYAGRTVGPMLGDIRNVTVYPVVYRGNYPGALKDGYDVYYRISIVEKVASILNISTAGKNLGKLVSEIAYAQLGNPSMKLNDGIINGLKTLEGTLAKSHGLGGIRFVIVVEWERLEEHNHWLGGTCREWVKKRDESDPYPTGYMDVYLPNDPHDMRKMQQDLKEAMINFPKTVNIQ